MNKSGNKTLDPNKFINIVISKRTSFNSWLHENSDYVSLNSKNSNSYIDPFLKIAYMWKKENAFVGFIDKKMIIKWLRKHLKRKKKIIKLLYSTKFINFIKALFL